MLFVELSGLNVIVGREPSIDGGRDLSRHFDLAERDAQRSAAEPVVR